MRGNGSQSSWAARDIWIQGAWAIGSAITQASIVMVQLYMRPGPIHERDSLRSISFGCSEASIELAFNAKKSNGRAPGIRSP